MFKIVCSQVVDFFGCNYNCYCIFLIKKYGVADSLRESVSLFFLEKGKILKPRA